MAALEEAREWLERDEVVAVGLGQRQRGGRFHVHELCVVATVTDKLPRIRLAPARQAGRGGRRRRALPRSIKVQVKGNRYSVPVDVQHSWGERRGRLHGIVCDKVNLNGEHIGAVGAVVTWNGQQRILVAGHVARERNRRLTFAGGVSGKVEELWFGDGWLDHAVIEPDQPLSKPECTLISGQPIQGLRSVGTSLVGQTVSCHDARTGVRHTPQVLNIYESVYFSRADTGADLLMHGLIAVTACTVPGDSGTLLYDTNQLAVGTLVGSLGGRSYFLPCDDCFAKIPVELARRD